MLDKIEQIKRNINSCTNETNRLKEENIVYKTRYTQYKAEKDTIIEELKNKGIDFNDLENILTNKLNELNNVMKEIDNLLHNDEYKIKDINLKEENVETIKGFDIPAKDTEGFDFGDFEI